MTVWVLGGAQTDFARNYAREGHGVDVLLGDAVRGALEATTLEASALDAAHVGNFTAELFCRQGQLGGVIASLHPDLEGLPTARHEAACASGSVAALAATAEIEAGRYDLVLVAGVEQMRNVPGDIAADYLGCAAWTGREAQDVTYVWPALFSRVAEEYDARFGLDRAHLVEVSRIDLENAQRNPRAQTRKWALSDAMYGENDEHNAVVEGLLRRQDCGRITDGAAAVILASEAAASAWAAARGIALETVPRILGWGHRTAPMELERKLAASREGPYVFPHLRGTLEDAWRRASLTSATDVDLIEVHDCFSITGYSIVDHLGLAPPGDPRRPLEDGTLRFGGALPMNPSGGLIGLGHPVGATGVRMLLDCAEQVRGTAGPTQVEGARRAQTLNIGGSATTSVSFVVGV
ncbi:MAG: thiolase domain-containing protein [Sandaracinaceae bacterium]|nr:thiolase domain-containing protein [Sandaracinaceae bacterium]